MTTIPDGAKVAYVGHEGGGFTIGDEGLVVEGGARGSHVRWDTGERVGQYDLVPNEDLVVDASLNPDETIKANRADEMWGFED